MKIKINDIIKGQEVQLDESIKIIDMKCMKIEECTSIDENRNQIYTIKQETVDMNGKHPRYHITWKHSQ
tara:strand:+ start:394 stop:600 length:207 start_codon:yes stop_codon:yes gene_type:complete